MFATTTVERLVTCDPNSGAKAFKEGSEDDESGFGLSTLCVNQSSQSLTAIISRKPWAERLCMREQE